MKLNKTMKKFVALVSAIAMIVAGITYTPQTVSAVDYDALTYTQATPQGEAPDLYYSIVDNSIVGWNTPWYGDAGNTFQLVYSADNKAEDTVIEVDDVATTSGVVTLVDNALVKLNPTQMADNAYTKVKITTTTGSATIIFKKGTPTSGGTVEPPVEEIPEGFTKLEEGWTPMGETINTTIGTDNPPAEASSWNIYVGTSWSGAIAAAKDGADGQDTVSVYAIAGANQEWGLQVGKVFQGLTAGTNYTYVINYTIDGTEGQWKGSEAADANGEIKVVKGIGTMLAKGQTLTVTGTTCEEIASVDSSEYVAWLPTERNLAYGKTATVSNHKEGNTDHNVLTDGTWNKWNGNYVGVTTPGYFEVDLGETYDASSIDQVVVWFRNGQADLYPAKGFKVQFGDATFETVATLTEYPDGAINSQADGSQYMVPVVLDKEQVSGNVRKVRIQVDDAVAWGTQITEIAVFAENPQLGEAPAPAENAAAVIVSSEKSSSVKGEIKVNITAGENQDGYKYFVYLDDATTASLENCDAGQDYTITGVPAGKHTVKVVSLYNGGASEGIVSDVVEVKTILNDVKDVSRNFAYGAEWELLAQEGSTLSHGSAEGNGDITNGTISGDDYVCPVKDTDGAYYIIDLGKEVDASLIDSVYVWYRVMEPGCAPQGGNSQDIKYSTDKETWTDVASVSGEDVIAARTEQGSAPYAVAADVSQATGTVRYIQIYYPKGVGYGAQVTEVAVFGETGIEAPAEPVEAEGLTATQVEKELKVSVSWTESEEAAALGQKYNVYVGDTKVLENVDAGTYEVDAVAGTNTIKVTAVLNDMETTGIMTTVDVEGTSVEPSESESESESDGPVTPVSERTIAFDVANSYLDSTGWVNAKATMTSEDGNATISIASTGNSEGDNSMWGLQAKSLEIKVVPGEKYTYTATIVSDTDKEVFVKVADKTTGDPNNEPELGSQRVQLKAGEPQNITIEFTPDVDLVQVVYAMGTMGTEPTKTNLEVSISDSKLEGKDPEEIETESESESETESESPVVTDPSATTTAPQVTTTAPKATTEAPKTTTTAPKKALGKTTVKKASKKLSAKKVKITFKKVKGAKKYQVQISKTKKFKKVLVKKTVKKVKVTITSKKLKNKKKLYVRVRAVGAKKWSKVKKIKIKK